MCSLEQCSVHTYIGKQLAHSPSLSAFGSVTYEHLLLAATDSVYCPCTLLRPHSTPSHSHIPSHSTSPPTPHPLPLPHTHHRHNTGCNRGELHTALMEGLHQKLSITRHVDCIRVFSILSVGQLFLQYKNHLNSGRKG